MSHSDKQRGRHRMERAAANPRNKRFLTVTAASLAVTSGLQIAAATTSSAKAQDMGYWVAPAKDGSVYYGFNPNVHEYAKQSITAAADTWNKRLGWNWLRPAGVEQEHQLDIELDESVRGEVVAAEGKMRLNPWIYDRSKADFVNSQPVRKGSNGEYELRDSVWSSAKGKRVERVRHFSSLEAAKKARLQDVKADGLFLAGHELGHVGGLDHPADETTCDSIMNTQENGVPQPQGCGPDTHKGNPVEPNADEVAVVSSHYRPGDDQSQRIRDGKAVLSDALARDAEQKTSQSHASTAQNPTNGFTWAGDHHEFTGEKDPQWTWTGNKTGGGQWTYNPNSPTIQPGQEQQAVTQPSGSEHAKPADPAAPGEQQARADAPAGDPGATPAAAQQQAQTEQPQQPQAELQAVALVGNGGTSAADGPLSSGWWDQWRQQTFGAQPPTQLDPPVLPTVVLPSDGQKNEQSADISQQYHGQQQAQEPSAAQPLTHPEQADAGGGDPWGVNNYGNNTGDSVGSTGDTSSGEGEW
ncbi:hypothetical protein ABZ070_31680 [Streptomyces sp. NPDC006283]|uniref:hypothetical protein n=1 Tax=Streptomyces sp. NPDC006283 TaxID=3156741 RepID=UPI0033B65A48